MKTRDEISAVCRQIVADHLKVDVAKVTEATTLADLDADSLHHIEITFELETEFDVEISDAEAEELKSVGQIVDWIAAHQQAVAA